jgi:prolyl-tRNA editing enzyme YbaK/EbsC (Cys-tRNA(Pro) deacylase)
VIVLFYVVGGILALGLGIWLGLPGRYDQTPEEIERIMTEGGRRRRKTKTVFTPLAWLQRKVNVRAGRSARRSGGQRRGFSLESPDDR